jgi:hypothetical protein
MRRKQLFVAGLAMGVLVTVLIGSVPPRVGVWEYGVYITGLGQDGEGRLWQRGSRQAGRSNEGQDYVYAEDALDFCKDLGIPFSKPIRTNTRVEKLAVELVILDHFGADGWELVDPPDQRGGVKEHLFKRTRRQTWTPIR